MWRQVLRGKELKYYERVEDSADNMKGKLSGNYGRPYEVPRHPLQTTPPHDSKPWLETAPPHDSKPRNSSGRTISSPPSAREVVVEPECVGCAQVMMLKDVREAPKESKAAGKGKGGAEAMSDVPTFDTFETEEEVRMPLRCGCE